MNVTYIVWIQNMTTEEIVDREILGATKNYEAFVKARPIISDLLQETGWNEKDSDIHVIKSYNGHEEWLS